MDERHDSPILETGEKVHIVERRFFVDDVRRHMVGEIVAVAGHVIRVRGWVWTYNPARGKFSRRDNIRERVLAVEDKIVVNIIPRAIDPEMVYYDNTETGGTMITDGKRFRMILTEFVERR